MVKRAHHTGTLKKTVRIRASRRRVWEKLSDISGLPEWATGVEATDHLSKKRRGVGAIRLITFANGDRVEEHVIAWSDKRYFTYVATEGLPLRAYVATLSIASKSRNLVELTWESWFNSKKTTEAEFSDFVKTLGIFYRDSLKNLKKVLEKT